MLRIFPGHRIKVLALIDKISIAFRANNNHTYYNTTRNFRNNNLGNTAIMSQKRFHSTGQKRLKVTTMKQLATIYGINKTIKKPKSVGVINSKNRIIKNFLTNEGFGFNYYLRDKEKAEMTDEEYNSVVNRGVSGQTESSDNKGILQIPQKNL